MGVDNINASDFQAKILAQKRRDLDEEKTKLVTEKGQLEAERVRQRSKEQEKTDKDMVQISKEGERLSETLRKANSDQVKQLSNSLQNNYEKLVQGTAESLKRLDAESARKISEHTMANMEKVTASTNLSDDPFYRLKTISPDLSETDEGYEVKVKLSPHEAENLYVSGEGNSVKLTLTRRFSDSVKDAEAGQTTKNSSYQSVVETLNLPKNVDSHAISKAYKDGVTTIKIPYLKPKFRV